MTAAGGVGVIFDCDGTLLDSMTMWHSLDDRIAERAGVVFTKADKDFLTAGTLRECADYMHDRHGIGASGADVERMINDETARWYANEAVARPGAEAFVRALHAAGVPMAVASSTPAQNLRLGLRTAGLEPYMSAIISVEDVGAPKREPVVYDAARAVLGTERERTWGFEDALYAVRTLAKAGYRTVGVHDSDVAGTRDELAAAADLFIASFTELSAEEFLAIAYAS